MIKVISFKICPFFQQITAMLLIKNIPFEVQYTSFDNSNPCIFNLGPNGKAPVLITESGEALFDSDAIFDYLDQAYPALSQYDDLASKALASAWRFQGSKNYISQCSTMRSESRQSFLANLAGFNKVLSMMENRLTGSRYFFSEQPSNVDISWLPILHRAALIEKHHGFDFFADYPRVKKWQQAVLALDLVQHSVSADFEQVFTSFYLSDNTFLGQNTPKVA